ncbi:MAG: FtsQ-type POTRA domain-containing protein [Rhodospirillales bacterium]|nr:FtsQ-type POTRA domain-containing protein [Rhodospirillales bacterium]
MKAGAAALVVGGLIGAAIGGKNSPFYSDVRLKAGEVTERVAQATGFTVNEILIVGRDMTPRRDLLDAVGVEFGAAILAINLEDVRERVLALPWIDTAQVERVLPDTLIVHLSERRPVALWQKHQQYSIVDREGRLLDVRVAATSFPELLVITGEDAPLHAATLLDLLQGEPSLMQRVEAASWIGGRRWNLILDNGMTIRLPEVEPEHALHRLANYERMHALLGKNIQTIDLRFSDKLIVQPREPSEEPSDQGQDSSLGRSAGTQSKSAQRRTKRARAALGSRRRAVRRIAKQADQ